MARRDRLGACFLSVVVLSMACAPAGDAGAPSSGGGGAGRATTTSPPGSGGAGGAGGATTPATTTAAGGASTTSTPAGGAGGTTTTSTPAGGAGGATTTTSTTGSGGGATTTSDAAAPAPVGAWPSSRYAALAADATPAADTAVITAAIDLPAATWVLVASDGRYGPAGGHAANVYVTIDGQKATNDAYIDWSESTNPVQHGFSAVGARWLEAGHHDVALVADVIDGPFYVGAGSNLSVMAHPADEVDVASLGQDSGEFAYTTQGDTPGVPTPHDALASVTVAPAAATDVVALAAARAYHAAAVPGSYGDAMIGIYLDGQNPGNDRSTWSVNDLWTGAETQAPFFAHAFLPALGPGAHTVSLDATEFPWTGSEDTVHYKVGAGSALVVARGGLVVRGSAPVSAAKDDSIDYVGVGTDQGWPGVPAVGTDVDLATATFTVPAGHSGVVLFTTRSRVQGDGADLGGTVTLRLVLDGAPVGSVGLQQLAKPDCVSQRTIGASYLAAGVGALAPGQHTIRAVARAEGSFIHLAMNKDLPLLWFD
jgi:hypothetical protein